MKQLLITSDDFGMCHAINAGIVRAMSEGIVRSTNFLAPCPWFGEAAELAKTYRLPVGVHLCLSCDWDRLKWGPLTRASSLTDKQGYFHRSFDELAKTAKDEEILVELEAQIRRVKEAGCEPTHVDSHMFGARDRRPIILRIKEAIRQLCDRHGLIYTYDYQPEEGLTYFRDEMICSGLWEPAIWSKLETWTEPGVYHLIGHAAEPAAELDAMCSVSHPSRYYAAAYRVADLAFFTRPSARERIEALGFELIGVRSLSVTGKVSC